MRLHLGPQYASGPARLRVIPICCWLIAAGSFLAPQARAGFIQAYDLANFTLTNQNADGAAVTPDGGSSVVFTGGNNGSGLSGSTDLTIAAAISGLVSFQYSYLSLDTPGFDTAGFLVNGLFTQLTDTSGDSGKTAFSIAAGQRFGFRMTTFDNQGEPGILTISNFSAPSSAAAAPEPATWLLALAAFAAFAARRALRAPAGVKERV